MSVGPSVNRTSVGGLFQRFLSAVRQGPRVNEMEDALRTRMNDGTEPSTALLLETLNKMFGRQFSLEGSTPSPADHYGQGMGTIPDGRGYTQLGGLGGDPGVAATPVGASIQAAMDEDPEFRQKLESALGGTLLNSGTPDGRLLVYQPQPGAQSPSFSMMAPSNGGQNSPTTSVQPMAVMHAASQAAGVPGVPAGMGPILTGLQQMEANVKKLVMEMGSKGDAPAQGQTDFQTMTQGILGQAQSLGGGGGDDEEGGLGDMPIGAGMMGQMSGQPGSNVKGLAAQNVAGAAMQPAGMSDTMKQQMLQQMMNQLRKFYELLSNVLKQMNEMQKTAIDNVKAG